ncbi:MAG: DNA polymerase III subunit epsilon [Castellaniella sp.]|uniref:DNA polymerase III subunit epsilon n=1 Tax=Castellaniella sp. TaxID=1955812 RepID=UPI002A36EBBD|nr:DNA polymerase III subunit epsilon [Castellaniella sp.]MDY0308793.1 DNA polymerase III subunit epsilon [Castellaniella sp.]
MRQIVLDTETTGLEPDQGHRVVELACVEILNRQVTNRHLHLYLNPDRDSDPEALRVHGLTTEFLSGHPRFPEVAQQLVDFVRDAEVIIHNAAFDVKFLNAELQRAQLPPFTELCAKITDSLLVAREMFPGKRNNLDALCERFGISNAHRTLHGALLDSELLGEVWLAMTRGQDSLLDEAPDDAPGRAGTDAAGGRGRFDASGLPVIQVDAQALQAHEAYLDGLDKAAGKACLWRQIESQAGVNGAAG